MRSLPSAFASILLCLLSACGGGGGSSGSVGTTNAAPSPSAIPAGSLLSTPIAAGPPLTEAVPQISVAVNGNTVTDTSSQTGGQITLTNDSSGKLRFLGLNLHAAANGSQVYNHSFDLSTATASTVAPFIVIADGQTFNDGNHANTIILDPSLSFASYGLWVNEQTTSSGGVGVIAFGQVTPIANMPSAGTATYSGHTIGELFTGNNAFALNGTAQLTANFSASTITGSFSNMMASSATSSVPWNTLNIAANLTGSNYQGTVSSPTNGSTLTPAALSGTVQGNFYGPQAQETAGLWQISGTNTTALGSFGAKRQ